MTKNKGCPSTIYINKPSLWFLGGTGRQVAEGVFVWVWFHGGATAAISWAAQVQGLDQEQETKSSCNSCAYETQGKTYLDNICSPHEVIPNLLATLMQYLFQPLYRQWDSFELTVSP